MGLSRYKLGELIELSELRNTDSRLGIDDVRGISIQKVFIPTKADMTNVSLHPYYLVTPDSFAYVTVTSRNGEKITLAHNDSENDTFIVSSSYVVFRVSKPSILNSDYLFMYFNRPEFDRYARFNSWGSARETFTWDDMCDIDIDLPPLEIQQKYVDIYNAMVANQKSYERGLDDLQVTAEGLLEKFKTGTPRKPLEVLIREIDERNTHLAISEVNGVKKEKQFMPSVASGADLSKYKLVKPYQFACNLMHVGRDVAVPVAMNTGEQAIIVSPAYLVFEVNTDDLIPAFLLSWLSRGETDRYAWFMSDTNVRSGMEKKRFLEIDVPIPEKKQQEALVEISATLMERRAYAAQIKEKIKGICPVLIKGSLDEAAREEEQL